jgi:hypothetical protein
MDTPRPAATPCLTERIAALIEEDAASFPDDTRRDTPDVEAQKLTAPIAALILAEVTRPGADFPQPRLSPAA